MEDKKVKSPFIEKYRLWLLFFVIALGVVGYFSFRKYGKNLAEMEMFTKYPERIVPDSAAEAKDVWLFPVEDTSISILDTLPLPDSIIVDIAEPSKKDSQIIEATPVVVDTIAKTPTLIPLKEDLFDALLPKDSKSESEKLAFLKLYKKDVLSSKALFKLASIAGKNILLNESQDMFEIFKILEMEEEVEGIILYDRTENIVYATNAKFKNASISSVMPDWQFQEEGLNWIVKEGRIITGVPIYSTYGRLGSVLIAIAPTAKK